MKRKISIKALTALLTVLIPILSWADNSITYTATYDYSKLTLGTDTLGGVTYTTVAYEGLYNDGEPGTPSLPVDYIRFSVPYNATNFSVSTVIGNTVTTKLNHMVYPRQTPRSMDDTIPAIIVLPNSTAYANDPDPLHPSPRAWVVKEGFLAGENHIVTVAVQPIANYHSTHGLIRDAIKKASSIELTLNYTITSAPKFTPIIREKDSLRNEGYELTRSIVVNSDDIESNAPLITRSTIPQHLIEDSIFDDFNPIIYDHPYLIITTEELKKSVRRIAALKRQKGYRVGIVTVEQIKRNPLVNGGDVITEGDTSFVAFDDTAGAIRQYLKYAYHYFGTKYVLLVGSDVPYRSSNSNNTWHGDWYYSELNSNWNTSNLDSIDDNAELYVGRLLVRQSQRIDYYSDKLFRYELNPGHNNHSYLQRALYTEGLDFYYRFSFLSGIFANNFNFNNTFIRERENINYPKGCDVLDSINTKQYGLFFSFNHGNPSSINVCGYDNPNEDYNLRAIDSIKNHHDSESGNGLNRMLNKFYPLIYYALSCKTMPYYKMPGYDIDLNYGESFTLGKDYGGPVYIGYTNTVYTQPIIELANGFAKAILNGHFILGEADALSRLDNYFIDARTLICHNYLGDPSVELWTGFPQHYSNISLTRTDDSIMISGISNMGSTYIAYVDNKGKTLAYLASSDTILRNVSPNGHIVLHRHNYIPYIAPLLLQNYNIARSQYVIASEMTAGNAIDSNRTNGDVIVKNGIEYEIEASGTVRLEDGFKVEKGATFVVRPSCY